MNQAELENALKQAQDAYYKGESIMSGLEFREVGADCEKPTIGVYDAQRLDKSKSFRTRENLQSWLRRQGFIVADWQLVDTSRDFNGAEAIRLVKME